MEWLEVSVYTTRDAAEAVANIFYDHGVSGVIIEDQGELISYADDNPWDYFDLPQVEGEEVIIKGYLSPDTEIDGKLASIRKAVKELPVFGLDVGSGDIKIAQVKEEDWANSWKAFYKPEKIGKRLVVKPSWEEYQGDASEVVIEMDPGMAFGTGTHPTTVMCMESLEKHIKGGETVFDMGTGSGILAISAAKLGAGHVYAMDKDPVAVRVAIENVERNNLTDSISVQEGDSITLFPPAADIIVANIVADVIIAICQDVYEHLRQKGVFIASGIIAHRFDDVKECFARVGFAIDEVLTQGEWVALVTHKLPPGV